MEVGPREVYEKQFQDAWRGYNQEEVDDFLDRVAESLDATLRENADLAERVRALEESVSTAREAEEMLRTTLVTAQQAAEEAMSKARAKAEQLVAEAQQLVDEAQERSRASADEAQERVSSLEADLRRRAREAERDQEQRHRELEQSIERLTAFESELKQKLADFLDRQREALASLSESVPAGVPASSRGQLEGATRDLRRMWSSLATRQVRPPRERPRSKMSLRILGFPTSSRAETRPWSRSTSISGAVFARCSIATRNKP